MDFEIFVHGEKAAELKPVTSGAAPDFTLLDLKGNEIRLSELKKTVLISVFPNINTRVCSLQTKHFNQEAAHHPEFGFLSISNNSAQEQRQWCAAEGVDMTILSDDGSFGRAYGLLMETGPLKGRLARAVFVIKAGEIVYHEILKETSEEPNYQAALDAAQ